MDDFHEGWVPATYLEPLYGSEDPRSQKLDEEEVHITLNAYTAQHDDEMSFEKGVLVEVFEKGFDGWWKIRLAVPLSLSLSHMHKQCVFHKYSLATGTRGRKGLLQLPTFTSTLEVLVE